MVSTRTFVERSHPTSSGRLLEGKKKKKNGEPEKVVALTVGEVMFTRASNSGVSLGKFWSFGREVCYDRWSLSRCGRTWRFDCMNSSWLKNTLSKKVLIKDIIWTIGSGAAEPKGAGETFWCRKALWSNRSKTSASAWPGYPETEKQMKAWGLRPSAFIVSSMNQLNRILFLQHGFILHAISYEWF